jgi:DNA-binding FadR family transcriptional regulator
MAVSGDWQEGKRAFSVAKQITADIVFNKVPAGELLGREIELLQRYGVSRDIFREALHQVEWLGIAKTVRGTKGGIYVQTPSEATAINLLRDYFDFSQASFADLVLAREVLEQELVRIVCNKLDDRDLARLRIMLGQYEADICREEFVLLLFRFYRLLMDIADNSVLTLCLMPLIFVTVDVADFDGLSDEAFRANSQSAWQMISELANAIIGGDQLLASKLVSNFLSYIQSSVPSKLPSVHSDATYPEWYDSSQSKLARNLVYQIHNDIRCDDLTIGDHFGTESELMARYRVSRGTFREACRVLEVVGVVEVHRGRAGGLKVAQSRPDNVVSAVVYYLNAIGADFNDIMAARAAIELMAISRAADNRDLDIADLRSKFSYQQSVLAAPEFVQASIDTQKALNRASNNGIFDVYYEVLLDAIYLAEHGRRAMAMLATHAKKVSDSQGAIIDAVCRGDAPLARRRAIQHHQLIKTYIGTG